jgi:hypothetical protein
MTHDGIVHGDAMLPDVVFRDGILMELHGGVCLDATITQR